jgi:hypothetical protein
MIFSEYEIYFKPVIIKLTFKTGVGWKKERCLLEGLQALSARPSNKNSVKMKMLGRIEAVV